MTMAVMSTEPFTGSTFVAAVRVMELLDGATSGTLWQLARPVKATTSSASRRTDDRDLENRCGTMRIAKDSTVMKLAGQDAKRQGPRRSEFDERGYIMVALLVGMAVVAVWMTALLPSWRQQIIREREAELVYRGEQYARAIVLYRTKNNNQLPPSIDVLVSGHYLRKKYLDPITGKDFIPVGGMTNTNPLGSPAPGGGGPTGGGPAGGGVNNAGGPGRGAPQGQPQGPGTTQGQVGISGVRS